MIVITGTVVVDEADREAFLALAETQVTNSREEEGCLGYRCGEDTMQRGVFTFIERWRDQAAVDEHFAKDYCRKFIAEAAKLARNEVAIELIHADRVDVRKVPSA